MSDKKQICKQAAYGDGVHCWFSIGLHVRWLHNTPEIYEVFQCTQCKKAKIEYLELVPDV